MVGGPIQYASQPGTFYGPLRRDVMRAIEILRSRGFEVFSAHEAEAFGDRLSEFTAAQIAHRDFSWMRAAHAYVAILPCDEQGSLMRTDGTHIEIGWASALDIPVLLLVDRAGRQQASLLLQGLVHLADVEIVEFETDKGCDVALIAARLTEMLSLHDVPARVSGRSGA